MAVNKYKEHVWVLAEDDATRQLANGFLLSPSLDGTRIDIRSPSRGWTRVLEDFSNNQVAGLRRYELRHLVLLIDFDNQVESRLQLFRETCPHDLLERVYMLGSRDEPEPLRTALNLSLEEIGSNLANNCADRSGSLGLWAHDLLKHNESEIIRLTSGVKHFLFR